MRRILTKQQAAEVLDLLEVLHPDAHCELNHNTPYELLVATILSAQCTDVRVNQVTPALFAEADTPEAMVALGESRLKELIRTCGFYNNKAANILNASASIITSYGGEVPQTIEELTTLAGVGKKTANVVASNCFGVPAIAVDTHVGRLANRIGFCDEKDPLKIEAKLEQKIDKSRWTQAHHTLIFHGRRICTARKPHCEDCTITHYCYHYRRAHE
ncbi:endonuclease III [Peptoniphilus equinus]|uniref:Endonuclease III n=1 Tax=Peptoniphilus equinus TaxID=3016343 RepID=A0ABY7QTQ7_9FIRM|nr:endonuclease III [Peptoniphilus equinus]WBW49469.1 endonuclease III [Peptoniphilus equinus]